MNATRLPDMIRELRGDETQLKFAVRTGVSLGTISNSERGAVAPSHDSMKKLIDEATRQGKHHLVQKIIRERYAPLIEDLKQYAEQAAQEQS